MSDIESWSELASGNGSAVPNGWPEGMAPGGVNDVGRETHAAVARMYNRRSPTRFTTGTANSRGKVLSYALEYTSAPTSYRQGQVYRFKAHAPCALTATLNINGLGAKPLLTAHPGMVFAVREDWITAGMFCEVVYDEGAGAFIVTSPVNFARRANSQTWGGTFDLLPASSWTSFIADTVPYANEITVTITARVVWAGGATGASGAALAVQVNSGGVESKDEIGVSAAAPEGKLVLTKSLFFDVPTTGTVIRGLASKSAANGPLNLVLMTMDVVSR